MDNCKHRKLQTWHFEDNDQPAGMWSCVACGHKFVPLDLAQEKDAERYRWLRGDPPKTEFSFWVEVSAGCYLDGADLDAAIDAMLAIKAVGAT